MEKRKPGRPPTDHPRPHRIGVRIGDEEKEILETYCENNAVTQSDAVNQAIRLLKST